MTKLFCDLKTDEEKSAFFLSGRGYETGVIAHSIQNDVAVAYQRCAEYRKELEALQSQPTESFPCRIIEADFETGTVTVEMQGKYTVSAGQKYLCNAPLQSQDREGAALAETLREAAEIIAAIQREHAPENIRWPIVDELEGFALMIDHARRAEGEGE